MWILIWILLSAILLAATIWSQRILLSQKRAWQQYARAKGLSYNAGTFMGPAEMTGQQGDYKLSFFTAERETLDVRTKRYVTVLEINLADGLVDGGVFGTKEMLPFMQTLDRLHPYKVTFAGWEEGMHAFVRHDAPIDAYLNAGRIGTISSLLKTRNADVILIFNDREIVVRLETTDPMQDAGKIEKIVKRTLGLIDQLRIDAAERSSLAALSAPVPPSAAPVSAEAPSVNPAAPPVANAPVSPAPPHDPDAPAVPAPTDL